MLPSGGDPTRSKKAVCPSLESATEPMDGGSRSVGDEGPRSNRTRTVAPDALSSSRTFWSLAAATVGGAGGAVVLVVGADVVEGAELEVDATAVGEADRVGGGAELSSPRLATATPATKTARRVAATARAMAAARPSPGRGGGGGSEVAIMGSVTRVSLVERRPAIRCRRTDVRFCHASHLASGA